MSLRRLEVRDQGLDVETYLESCLETDIDGAHNEFFWQAISEDVLVRV